MSADADVNVIDGKEHPAAQSSKAVPRARQAWTKANLPIKTSDDLRTWDTVFMGYIYDFIGSQDAQYGTNNNLKLKDFMSATWVTLYPLFKDNVNDPSITGVVSFFRAYELILIKFGL